MRTGNRWMWCGWKKRPNSKIGDENQICSVVYMRAKTCDSHAFTIMYTDNGTRYRLKWPHQTQIIPTTTTTTTVEKKKLYYYWIWRVCPSCEVLGNLSLLLLLFSTLIGTHFLALSNLPLKQMDGTSIIYYLYVHFSFSRYNLFIALNSARVSAFECMYKCVRMIIPNILSE